MNPNAIVPNYKGGTAQQTLEDSIEPNCKYKAGCP
jgi:hypothetical protein